MKRTHLLPALAFSIPAFSQTPPAKNMAKINASSFVFKGFGLQYERQVGPRITVALSYSAVPKSSVAFKSFIEDQINDPDIKVVDFRLGTSIFTPEARYYFGKEGAFHGFYLAPYIRFGGYNIEGPVTYTTSTNVKREAVFDGKLNTITGGLMAGSSFKLSEKFYLDWWIVGASFGGASGNLATKTALTAEEQMSLKRELDGISVVGTKVTSEVNAAGATVTTTGNMVGFRGLGLNIGMRF